MDAPFLTTWEDRGPGFVAVVYCHATYPFIYKFSYVVIMSVHNPALITDFLWCLKVVNDFFLSVSYLGFHYLHLHPYWITLRGPIFQNYLQGYVNEHGHFLKSYN